MPAPNIRPRTDPIIVRQGESLDCIILVLQNPDGTAYNLFGWTSHAAAREVPSSSSAFLDLTTENGGIVIDPIAGTIGLHVTGATTAAGAPKSYDWDWFVFDALGRSACLWDSSLIVIETSTHYP